MHGREYVVLVGLDDSHYPSTRRSTQSLGRSVVLRYSVGRLSMKTETREQPGEGEGQGDPRSLSGCTTSREAN